MRATALDTADLAQLRLDNALLLFDEFVALHVRTPDAAALRGLERRFAEQLLIQPSYWSQLKSRTRQIGERLARQFESRCGKPLGWMDVPHGTPSSAGFALQLSARDHAEPDTSSAPRNDDERFIVGLVLTYYRRHPQRARARLLDLLGEVLTPAPAGADAPRTAVTPPARTGAASTKADDEHALWLRSQSGVAPLKRKR